MACSVLECLGFGTPYEKDSDLLYIFFYTAKFFKNKAKERGELYMAKINNIIRLLDYKDANDLYSQIDRDLETCRADHRIYKLHTVQNISQNKALVVMEEDTNRVPIYFFYKYISDGEWKYEKLEFDDVPSWNIIMSVQELQMLKILGELSLDGEDYIIDKIKYCIEATGEKYASIILKYNYKESEE